MNYCLTDNNSGFSSSLQGGPTSYNSWFGIWHQLIATRWVHYLYSNQSIALQLLEDLKQYFQHFRPVPTKSYSSSLTFVHPRLKDCSHVFTHGYDTERKPPQPPYDGPFKVLHHHTKTFDVEVYYFHWSAETNIPAVPDTLPSIVNQVPPEKTRSATPQTVTTCIDWKVHFLKCYTS